VVPATGAGTTFTAGAAAGRAVLTATAGTLKATARITITKPVPRVAFVGTKMVAGHLVVTARVLAARRPAAGVRLQLKVRKGASVVALVLGRTKGDGRLVWRSKHPLPRAHYVVRATIRSASTA
jgi:hypothetical protein